MDRQIDKQVKDRQIDKQLNRWTTDKQLNIRIDKQTNNEINAHPNLLFVICYHLFIIGNYSNDLLEMVIIYRLNKSIIYYHLLIIYFLFTKILNVKWSLSED